MYKPRYFEIDYIHKINKKINCQNNIKFTSNNHKIYGKHCENKLLNKDRTYKNEKKHQTNEEMKTESRSKWPHNFTHLQFLVLKAKDYRQDCDKNCQNNERQCNRKRKLINISSLRNFIHGH